MDVKSTFDKSSKSADNPVNLKNKPLGKFILFFILLLILIYLCVYLIASVEERTRVNLLLYSCFGFTMAHYLYLPITKTFNFSPYMGVIVCTVAVVALGLYSFEHNHFIDALLKWFFLTSGGTIYLYLKFAVFNQFKVHYKKKPKRDIFIIAIATVFIFLALALPIDKKTIVVYKNQVTSNRPFAGVLTLGDRNFYESTDVCCVFWLSTPDSLRVVENNYLFYSTLTPIK
jgi:hypothetical protein